MKKGKLIIGILATVSVFNLYLCNCDNIAETYPTSNTQVIHNDLIEDMLQSIKDNSELKESDFEIINTSEMADISVQTSINKKTKKIYTYPDDEYTANYKNDMKLSDIPLPNKWKWEDEDTPIDIGEYTYKAIYTTDDDYVYIGQTEKKIKVIIEKSIYKVSGITITITEGTSLTNDLLPALEKGTLEWITPNETVYKNCTKVCRFTPYDATHYNSIDNINVIINITPKINETDKKDTSDKTSDENVATNDNNSVNSENSDKNTTDKKKETESNKTSENNSKPQNIQVGIDNNSENVSDNELGVNTSVRPNSEYQLPTISLGLGEDIDINNSNLSNNELADIEVTESNFQDNTEEDTKYTVETDDEEGESTDNEIEEVDENLTTENGNEEKNKVSENSKTNGKIDIFGIIAIIGVTGIGGYAFVNKMKSHNTSRR